MHREQRAFVEWALFEVVDDASRVVDLGGADRNGSLRQLFRDSDNYVVVDIEAGPGVDVVANAALYDPPEPPTLVMLCEVLEHVDSPMAAGIIGNVGRMLAPGGQFLVTCATDGRAPHRADGEEEAPLEGEFYRNVSVWQLLEWVGTQTTLVPVVLQVRDTDLYMVARKPEP